MKAKSKAKSKGRNVMPKVKLNWHLSAQMTSVML